MDDTRRPKRHVYLPGMTAFDPVHSASGAEELRAHKTGDTRKYDPGYVFVDSPEHARAAYQNITERLTKYFDTAEDRRTRHDNELATSLMYALDNIRVIGRKQDMTDVSATNQDKLYVKGHGNPRKGASITGRVVNERDVRLQDDSLARVKRSTTETLDVAQVGKGVHGIAQHLGVEAMQVRSTACGSAGTYDLDQLDPTTQRATQTNINDSFAGQLQADLDTRGAQSRIDFQVMGYRGDANSTHRVGPDLHHITRIKQGVGGRDPGVDPRSFMTAVNQFPGNAFEQTTFRGPKPKLNQSGLEGPDRASIKRVSSELSEMQRHLPDWSTSRTVVEQVAGPRPRLGALSTRRRDARVAVPRGKQ